MRASLAGLTPEGELRIQFAGGEVRTARYVVGLSPGTVLDAVRECAAVLVDFIDGDPDAPVVLGLLMPVVATEEESSQPSPKEQRIEVRAAESLTLTCGAAAIELTRDGRVALRGTDVTTESAGAIKLKGGSVQIN